MKKIYIALVAVFAIIQFSYAQTSPWSLNGSSIYNTNTGNVGIGTSSPGSMLSIKQGGTGVSITPGGSPYFGTLAFNRESSTGAIFDPSGNAFQFTSGPDPNLHLSVFNGSGVSVADNALSIAGSNGNVGVGTSSPLSLFQVGDSHYKASLGDASNTSDLNWGTSYMGFNAARAGTSWTINGDGFHNGGGVIYSTIFGDIYFATISSSGTGTQTLTDSQIASNIKLHIAPDGTLLSKRIVVQTTIFPDYVFKPTYRLRPLSEVKSYIDKNHHLPEMPTAEKVEKDGMDLAEMNKLLTKKVEELTLYLIDKDTKLKSQEARLDQLETKFKKIKSLLKHSNITK